MIQTKKSFLAVCDNSGCEITEVIIASDKMAAELEMIRRGWRKLSADCYYCPRCTKKEIIVGKFNAGRFGPIIVREKYNSTAAGSTVWQ